MKERERALNILQRVDKEKLFAAPLLESGKAEERDRRFLRTLVLGVLRWRSRLDYIIETLSSRRMNQLDALTRDILRLGIYQLLFTDVPPHAAVNESVELASRRNARSKGLVNAVLRKAAGSDLKVMNPAGESTASAAVRLGNPEWLLKRWETQYGRERARSMAAAGQQLSWADLFINEANISIDEAHRRLRALDVTFTPSPFLHNFVRLESSSLDVRELVEQGLVYPMDEGSALVASVVSRAAGTVLDLTAAPGGKSLLLLARGTRVVSNDVSLQRLGALRESASRLGLTPRLLVSNAEKPPLRRRVASVLLDAPCSATGTIRRNPELKWRLDLETIQSMAAQQKRMLQAALDTAEDECVYSTCSLEREENDEVVAAVLSRRDDFELTGWDDLQGNVREFVDGAALRILPDRGPDGFTVHRLRRKRS